MVAVNAAPSAPSSFVGDTPVRILDTRTDVGLPGPFVSGQAQTLQVAGTAGVPLTATSVVFNVTVVNPTTKGFLSIRPGDATGTPATSNINWAAGGANIANAVTVQLAANGTINIFVDGTVGEVLIDVVGYYIPGGAGAKGDQGDQGDPGPAGVIGDITMSNGNGPTDIYQGFGGAISPGGGVVVYSADTTATMQLNAPVTIGGEDRRLHSLEYCLAPVDPGAGVVSVLVTSGQYFPVPPAPEEYVIDDTIRTAEGCYVVDLSTLAPGMAYDFNVQFAPGGITAMLSVQTTWTTTPATPILAPVSTVQSSPAFPPLSGS
jgi:hypothetical protein